MPREIVTCQHCAAEFALQEGVSFHYCPTCGQGLEGSRKVKVTLPGEVPPPKPYKPAVIPPENGTAYKSARGEWFCLVCKMNMTSTPRIKVEPLPPVAMGSPAWAPSLPTSYYHAECPSCHRCIDEDGSVPPGTYQISDPVPIAPVPPEPIVLDVGDAFMLGKYRQPDKHVLDVAEEEHEQRSSTEGELPTDRHNPRSIHSDLPAEPPIEHREYTSPDADYHDVDGGTFGDDGSD
jgi:hypothetical protein